MKQLPGGRRNSNDLNNQELMAFHVSTLKHNIFSNLAGGAWVAVLTLAITPIQINLLGVEAFGLIVKWGIEGAAVAYMGLGYFTLGAAVRSDITRIIQRIMQREEAIL